MASPKLPCLALLGVKAESGEGSAVCPSSSSASSALSSTTLALREARAPLPALCGSDRPSLVDGAFFFLVFLVFLLLTGPRVTAMGSKFELVARVTEMSGGCAAGVSAESAEAAVAAEAASAASCAWFPAAVENSAVWLPPWCAVAVTTPPAPLMGSRFGESCERWWRRKRGGTNQIIEVRG